MRSMQTTHTRTANGGDYGEGMGRWVTVQVLAPSRRGAQARGTHAGLRGWGGSAPKGAKRAKRQGADRMGRVPHVVTTNWRNV